MLNMACCTLPFKNQKCGVVILAIKLFESDNTLVAFEVKMSLEVTFRKKSKLYNEQSRTLSKIEALETNNPRTNHLF